MYVPYAGDDAVYAYLVGGDGLHVDNVTGHGVYVDSAGGDGVRVENATDDGVQVYSAGDDGVDVGSVDGHGVRVGRAGGDGVYVAEAGSPSETRTLDDISNGLEVAGAEGAGLYVGQADDYGVFVFSAGIYGVAVWNAAYDALYGNSTNPNGEWGLRTPDKISADNVTASAWTLVAQVDGPGALTAGDLAAVSGVADPLPDSATLVPQVRLADGRTWNGVIGVVDSRMALEPVPGKKEEGALVLHSVPGAARAGDYVALTVLGVAQVKVDASVVNIVPGGRLTAADLAGHARGLRTETLNGVPVTEGAPVIGIALAAPTAESDTIPVFVTLR